MRLLLDEHIPRSIERLFTERGHVVMRAPGGASDLDLVASADRDGLIVVAADRHFRLHITRNPNRDRRRFTRAGLIKVPGEAHIAIERVAKFIEVIEFLFEACQLDDDKRLIIEIRPTSVHIDF